MGEWWITLNCEMLRLPDTLRVKLSGFAFMACIKASESTVLDLSKLTLSLLVSESIFAIYGPWLFNVDFMYIE